MPWYLRRRWHIALLLLHRALAPFAPLWTKDEGYWWAMGASVARGGSLYVDGADNKPPLFLWAYAAAIKWCGALAFPVLHLLVIVGNLLIATLLYRLAKTWWDDNSARYVSLCYVVLQITFTAQEQLAANSENLMLPWLVGSFALIARSIHQPRRHSSKGWNPLFLSIKWIPTFAGMTAFFSGLALGIAAGLRHTAILVAPAYLIALWIGNHQRWRHIATFCLGLTIPFAAMYAHFVANGTFDDAWFWNITLTQLYIGESLPLRQILIDMSWKIPAIVLCALPIWWLAGEGFAHYCCSGEIAGDTGGGPPHERQQRANSAHSMSVTLSRDADHGGSRWQAPPTPRAPRSFVWLLLGSTVAMLAATSIGLRFSHHYFIQLFPFLALLAGAAIHQRTQQQRAAWPISGRFALGWLALTTCAFTIEAWTWGIASLQHRHPKRVEYIGATLKTMAQPDDALFVWGYYPEIYFDSGLRNASRYVETHFLTGQIRDTKSDGLATGKEQLWHWLWSDLERNPPRWIVDTTAIKVSGRHLHGMDQHQAFRAWVTAHYTEAAVLPRGVVVYRRSE